MGIVKQYTHPHAHKIFSHPAPLTKKTTHPLHLPKIMPHSPPNHPYPLKIMFIPAIILGGWRLVEKYFPWVKVGGGGGYWGWVCILIMPIFND